MYRDAWRTVDADYAQTLAAEMELVSELATLSAVAVSESLVELLSDVFRTLEIAGAVSLADELSTFPLMLWTMVSVL